MNLRESTNPSKLHTNNILGTRNPTIPIEKTKRFPKWKRRNTNESMTIETRQCLMEPFYSKSVKRWRFIAPAISKRFQIFDNGFVHVRKTSEA